MLGLLHSGHRLRHDLDSTRQKELLSRVWCRISGCAKCAYDWLVYNNLCCGGTGSVFKNGHKGVFSDTQWLTYENITDGTSTTIMYTEMAGRPLLWAKGIQRNLACTATYNWKKRIVGIPGGCWACFANAEEEVNGSTYLGTNWSESP